MIEKYIEELLDLQGNAPVPNLGTFFIQQQSAVFEENAHVLAPPSEVLTFAEGVASNQKDLLRNFIFEKEEAFASQIEAQLENYVSDLHEQLSEYGEATVGTLGTLRKSGGSLQFEPSPSRLFQTESFGLPKLEVYPLDTAGSTGKDNAKEDTEEDTSEHKQTKSALVPLLILAPLVLLAVVITYLFFNPVAYENLKAIFPDRSAQPAASQVPEERPAPPTVVDETPAPTETTTDAVPTADVPKEKPSTPPANTTTPAPTNTRTSADVVSAPTNRYYLIAASLNSEESAKKALAEARGKGYRGAKIIQADGRYRLSIGDYPTRAEATAAAVEFGEKDYKGAWPLKY